MSELLALGISHKTAPVALRERLAFTEAEACEFAGEAIAVQAQRTAVSRRDPVRARCDPRETRCTGGGAEQHAESRQARDSHDDAAQKQLPADGLLS